MMPHNTPMSQYVGEGEYLTCPRADTGTEASFHIKSTKHLTTSLLCALSQQSVTILAWKAQTLRYTPKGTQ